MLYSDQFPSMPKRNFEGRADVRREDTERTGTQADTGKKMERTRRISGIERIALADDTTRSENVDAIRARLGLVEGAQSEAQPSDSLIRELEDILGRKETENVLIELRSKLSPHDATEYAIELAGLIENIQPEKKMEFQRALRELNVRNRLPENYVASKRVTERLGNLTPQRPEAVRAEVKPPVREAITPVSFEKWITDLRAISNDLHNQVHDLQKQPIQNENQRPIKANLLSSLSERARTAEENLKHALEFVQASPYGGLGEKMAIEALDYEKRAQVLEQQLSNLSKQIADTYKGQRPEEMSGLGGAVLRARNWANKVSGGKDLLGEWESKNKYYKLLSNVLDTYRAAHPLVQTETNRATIIPPAPTGPIKTYSREDLEHITEENKTPETEDALTAEELANQQEIDRRVNEAIARTPNGAAIFQAIEDITGDTRTAQEFIVYADHYYTIASHADLKNKANRQILSAFEQQAKNIGVDQDPTIHQFILKARDLTATSLEAKIGEAASAEIIRAVPNAHEVFEVLLRVLGDREAASALLIEAKEYLEAAKNGDKAGMDQYERTLRNVGVEEEPAISELLRVAHATSGNVVETGKKIEVKNREAAKQEALEKKLEMYSMQLEEIEHHWTGNGTVPTEADFRRASSDITSLLQRIQTNETKALQANPQMLEFIEEAQQTKKQYQDAIDQYQLSARTKTSLRNKKRAANRTEEYATVRDGEYETVDTEPATLRAEPAPDTKRTLANEEETAPMTRKGTGDVASQSDFPAAIELNGAERPEVVAKRLAEYKKTRQAIELAWSNAVLEGKAGLEQSEDESSKLLALIQEIESAEGERAQHKPFVELLNSLKEEQKAATREAARLAVREAEAEERNERLAEYTAAHEEIRQLRTRNADTDKDSSQDFEAESAQFQALIDRIEKTEGKHAKKEPFAELLASLKADQREAAHNAAYATLLETQAEEQKENERNEQLAKLAETPKETVVQRLAGYGDAHAKLSAHPDERMEGVTSKIMFEKKANDLLTLIDRIQANEGEDASKSPFVALVDALKAERAAALEGVAHFEQRNQTKDVRVAERAVRIEEKRVAEEERLARVAAEERRIQEVRAENERRAEEKRLADDKRLAEEKRAQEQRPAEQMSVEEVERAKQRLADIYNNRLLTERKLMIQKVKSNRFNQLLARAEAARAGNAEAKSAFGEEFADWSREDFAELLRQFDRAKRRQDNDLLVAAEKTRAAEEPAATPEQTVEATTQPAPQEQVAEAVELKRPTVAQLKVLADVIALLRESDPNRYLEQEKLVKAGAQGGEQVVLNGFKLENSDLATLSIMLESSKLKAADAQQKETKKGRKKPSARNRRVDPEES